MIPPKTRMMWALALGLVLGGRGWAPATAHAAPIAYNTVGMVTPPSDSSFGLVYFKGTGSGSVDVPGSIDLGSFVVSTLTKTNSAKYNQSPFQIVTSVGGTASEQIKGYLDGEVGPGVASPKLTATITSVSQFGKDKLPFGLTLPLNTPLALALPTGNSDGLTGLTGAATLSPPAVPEPASIAVFTVALGGLGLWRRRRAAVA